MEQMNREKINEKQSVNQNLASGFSVEQVLSHIEFLHEVQRVNDAFYKGREKRA